MARMYLQETDWLVSEYLPIVAESPPLEILGELELLIESYGRRDFAQIWQRTPVGDQIKLIRGLLLGLPREELLLVTAGIES